MVSRQAPTTHRNVRESYDASLHPQPSQETPAAEESRVSHAFQALQDVQSFRDVQAPQDVQVLLANQSDQIRQDAEAAQEDQEETATVQTATDAQAVQPPDTQIPHQFSPQAQPFLPAQPVQIVHPTQPAQPVQPVQALQPFIYSFSASRQSAQLLHGLSAIQIQAVPQDSLRQAQHNQLPRIPQRTTLKWHHDLRDLAQFEPRNLTPQVKAPGHPQHCLCLACLFPRMVNPPCDPYHIETRIDNLGCLCPGRGGRLGIQRILPCLKHDWGARWGWLARGGPWKDGRQRPPARIPEICQRPIDPVVFREWIESLPCRCEEWKISWNLEAQQFKLAIQADLWLGAGIRCNTWLQQYLATFGRRYQSQDEFAEAVREMLNFDFELELAPHVQEVWDDWRQTRYALMEPAPAILQNNPQFRVQFAKICSEYIAPNLWLQSLNCDCVTWKDEWKRLIRMLWGAHPASAALQILPWSRLAQDSLIREWQTRKTSLQALRATNLAIEDTRRQRPGFTIIPPFNGSAFGNHQGRFTNIYLYMGQRFGNTSEDQILENRLNFLGHKSIWRPSAKGDGCGPYIEKPYDRAGSTVWPNTADYLSYGPMWHQGEGGIFGRVLPPVMQRFPPYRAPLPQNPNWNLRLRLPEDPNIPIDQTLPYLEEDEPIYEPYDGLWDESRLGRPSGPTRDRDGRSVVHFWDAKQGKLVDQDGNIVALEDPGLDMLPFDALWSKPHYGPRTGLRDPHIDNQDGRDAYRKPRESFMRYEEKKYLLPYLVEALNDPDIMEVDDGGAAAEAELESWKAVSWRLPKRSRYFLMKHAGK